ncbi:SGNH/GDSL hydrolase family protein [Heyndrickxia acidicola]|uniref:SGNH/GDSL hydrolase family protein n=1 Tax=Heyndrickxia acidicola TaxID=209389 RepID=A0ABU6ML17_9BACI|nr:SGNH/GDSL hydrolase family protein [Heyndrickxia acidicola]MED1205375.1 SGNH/GDSL hydrolase family protein [Heyndrickxia acidicola]
MIKQFSQSRIQVEKKPHPPSDFIPKNITITAAGDSLTQGVGDSTKSGGYIPYLKKDLQSLKGVGTASFSNYGIQGNRTDQLLSRLQSQSSLRKSISHSDAVIITIGGNDVMKVFEDHISDLKVGEFQTAIFGYEHRLQELMKTIRTLNPHASIILIGIYNPFMEWFSNVQELDEIVANWNNVSMQVVAGYKNAEFVPVYDIFNHHEKDLLYTDYFHPNDKGYKLIANRVFRYMQNKQIDVLTK